MSSSRLMQLSDFLKVPITYFYEDFKDYKPTSETTNDGDDLNYSFLSKTFSNLSKKSKDKILQVLKNVVDFEKLVKSIGSSGRTRTCDQLINSQLLYQLSYRGIKIKILFLRKKTTNFLEATPRKSNWDRRICNPLRNHSATWPFI